MVVPYGVSPKMSINNMVLINVVPSIFTIRSN